jgi:hypothetical protein
MAIVEDIIPERKTIRGSKNGITVAATKKIAVFVDGVEDTDLSYTVAEGKTLLASVIITGELT